MSVDLLQEKIRKTKSAILVDLSMKPEHIPEGMAMEAYCRELMTALKGKVSGVRFNFDQWAVMDDLKDLGQLMEFAREQGYYVLLDGPSVLAPWEADRAADLLERLPADGMVISPYIGSDAVKPFLKCCQNGKSLFLAVRTPNKSAAELQDLMTGSRLVHVAAADLVKRHGETVFAKCGYSHMGVLTAATNANAVMGLRTKYNRMFLIVDGLDYPGGNGKNCSTGFDKFGHGCAMSVGPEITAAWKESQEPDAITAAVNAADRIRNNMNRYITIL